jgi:hypothetical protein
MDDRRKLEAIAAVRREIARRVARFCTSLSPEEFDKLLDRMAHIQWKYEVFPHGTEHPRLVEPGSPTSEASTMPRQGTIG